MNLSIDELAPALIGIFAGALGLFLVWLAVREAHSEPRKRPGSKQSRPDPDPAE